MIRDRNYSELTTKIGITSKTIVKGWDRLNERGLYDHHHIQYRAFFQSLKGKSNKELDSLCRELESQLPKLKAEK